MHSRAAEQIDQWPTRPADGLAALSRSDFTGAVSGAGAWLFMLNGHAVGVVDGTVETIAGADDLAAHEASAPSLPLLFAMLERDGEERGRYYTEQTSLREVHETLREGGFTGYVELSENVLSGDYYAVYYGGDPTYAAFLGESDRAVTGEEVLERAAAEVGIYTVTAVEIAPLDLPEPESEPGSAGAAAAGAATADPSGSKPDGSGEAQSDASASAAGPVAPEVPDETDAPASPDAPDAGADPEPAVVAGRDLDSTASSEPTAAPRADDGPFPPTLPTDLAPAVRHVPAAPAPTVPEAPAETGPARDDTQGREGAAVESIASTPAAESGAVRARTPGDGAASGTDADTAATDADERAAELEARVDRLEADNDRLEAERENLRAERDRLRERVAELEGRLAEASSAGAASDARSVSLTPEEALAGTDLFVRYRSRSDATLEDAHAGADNRGAVEENLELEHHTRFDADAAAVDGTPFEEYVAATVERRVVSWLVRDLLYEIRDTGHADRLRALYDALPEVDRAELHGEVETEDGTVGFDVVCRDRLGNPLLCVDVHASREPATRQAMASLLERSGAVAAVHDGFAGSFLVAESFFDPGALELADERTASGGLLGGGKRASFVKLTRKRGYHLCLVEGRSGRFHVTVPEL